MNLLEIVADVSAQAHASKEVVAANAEHLDGCVCNTDYCRAELTAGVMAFRGGHHVVSLWLADLNFRYSVDIAARLFGADAIAVALDGRSKQTDRAMIVVTAVNRAGDELWRVEPYSLAPDGRSVIWWPAEVPDQHPILDSWCADELVKTMNKRTMPYPPMLNDLTPGLSFEQRQAIVDVGITRQIQRNADKPWHNIVAVSLASDPDTDRDKVLQSAAQEPRLWL